MVFSMWELELLQELREGLVGVVVGEGEDVRWWKSDDGGVFTVKSCYFALEKLRILEEGGSREEEEVFRYLWKSSAPSKVLVFSWTLLLDRIPTKANLDKRRMLDEDVSRCCCFCDNEGETSIHLFLHCDVVCKVWLRVMRWFEVSMLTPPNLFIHLNGWTNAVRGKNLRRGAWIIWHATIWVV